MNTRLVLLLTENWTMTSSRDLPGLVRLAVEAEGAGFDAVMASEHLVLGPAAGADGPMRNPREYAMPGNQEPDMPWPSSIVLLSAIAAATTRLRLVAGAIIAPLRHPLLLAKELATLDLLSQGRLVVLPTVSWHRQEYEALGVDWAARGELLDEHLAAWRLLWRDGPATFTGRHYRFEDVFVEPKPYRPEGPTLWFGGSSVHGRLVRRLVEYGSGFSPMIPPKRGDMDRIAAAMREAGRDIGELELVGGTRGRFSDADGVADLDLALSAVPPQKDRGYNTICIKPSQFIDDPADFRGWCEEVVARVSITNP